MKQSLQLLLISMFALLASGCLTSSLSGNTYSRGEARTAQSVQFGTIDSIRTVNIEGTKSGTGKVAGGLLGGIAGSSVGHGRSSYAGAVAGAVVGGIAGNAAEEAITKSQGLEITVKLDNGKFIAVVQQADANESFSPGDRVRIVGSGSSTRVTH